MNEYKSILKLRFETYDLYYKTNSTNQDTIFRISLSITCLKCSTLDTVCLVKYKVVSSGATLSAHSE